MRWWGAWVVLSVACGHAREPRPAPPAVQPSPAATTARFTVPRPDPIPPLLRLDDTAEPRGYTVNLAIDSARLAGTIDIDVELQRSTDVIFLHGTGLTIESAFAISGSTHTQLEARELQRFDGPQRFLALLSIAPMPAGRYTLRITYAAKAVDLGDVDSRIDDPFAEKPFVEGAFVERAEGHRFLFTMSEPMGARRVFPCFDEPRFKVPWTLALDVPATDLALSNTNPVAVVSRGDRTRYEFETTPPLPSYLVAFAVGPFELVSAGVTRRGVPLRVAVRPGHAADAAWASRFLAPLLAAAEDWTQVPFPYPKLDLVAVPLGGENWGAMENPGLITIAEIWLGEVPSLASILAHELVHHWFGDFVTPGLWDDVWLNEGFAYWLGGRLTDDYVRTLATPLPVPGPTKKPPPGWRPERWTRPAVAIPSAQAQTDARSLAPYITGELTAPFLDLLETVVGADVFRQVLHRYLLDHAHGTVATDDLASLASAATGLPLGPVFREALRGFPSRHVEIEIRCPPAAPPSIAVLRVEATPIVLCIAHDANGARKDTCLVSDSKLVEVPVPSCPRWVVPDPRGLGIQAQLANVDALLANGWLHFDVRERLRIANTLPSQSPARLAAALRLVEEHDAPALELAAETLYDALPFVSERLRVDLDAKLRAKTSAAGRRASWTGPSSVERASAMIALLARDPLLAAHARDLVETLEDAGYQSIRDYARAAAYATDPVLAGRALEKSAARYDLRRALAHAPLLVPLVVASGLSRPDLVTKRCEARDRADALRLGGPDAEGRLTECLLRRAGIERVVTAWLAAP